MAQGKVLGFIYFTHNKVVDFPKPDHILEYSYQNVSFSISSAMIKRVGWPCRLLIYDSIMFKNSYMPTRLIHTILYILIDQRWLDVFLLLA